MLDKVTERNYSVTTGNNKNARKGARGMAHLTVADLKRAFESPVYSPNVYVEIRDRETDKFLGLYQAVRVTPMVKKEPGAFFGAMVITAYADNKQEDQTQSREERPESRSGQGKESHGGLLQYIRDLLQ